MLVPPEFTVVLWVGVSPGDYDSREWRVWYEARGECG
jgi:hypothetical protein